MCNTEVLKSIYDFSPAPNMVNLTSGIVNFRINNEAPLTGLGTFQLRFLPTPRLTIKVSIEAPTITCFDFILNHKNESVLYFNNQILDGFCGKREIDGDSLVFEWLPKLEPLCLYTSQPTQSASAILHLFNFTDFQFGNHQATAPKGCSILKLESEHWIVTVQSLPDQATQTAWKRINNEGGCLLTHVAKLERKDGQLFSCEESLEQHYLINNFFSFIRGGRCHIICEVGLSSTGEKTWERFATPKITNPPYTWFNPWNATQAEKLFPLFSKRWQQSEDWRSSLSSAIYWYLQANTSGGSPGIDAGIILAQSALERLAHHSLVVDKKMVSSDGLDRLKTSDRLRLLFSSLNLPLEINTATPEINKIAKQLKWVDAPHAITDIRNELVHPVSKRDIQSCLFDGWKLSVWYLELSILALCDYADTYTSRLTAKNVTDSEKVPWEL